MNVNPLRLSGALLLEPRVFGDPRGIFFEAWNEKTHRAAGVDRRWVQDNVSRSSRGVLRGLHFQNPKPQAKLVSCLEGEVWDVIVDLRRSSPTFGQWEGCRLSPGRQLFVPVGFAHGFYVVSESAIVSYKCDDFWSPETERGVAWDDPALGIAWPTSTPLLSEKDRSYPRLSEVGHLFE
jgi:dTDP-4-dehydrorhamnose 3,5-epimerase